MSEAVHNAPDLWDTIWRAEGEDTWRQKALSTVYTRIERLVVPGAHVVDLGGGNGALARVLADKASVEVWDHSEEAIRQVQAAGIFGRVLDLQNFDVDAHTAGVAVGTEILEHLPEHVRRRTVAWARRRCGSACFSVPNDRLGPDEEPQHTIKFTALSFLIFLREFWGADCRVEVLGPYLLGVCGEVARKRFRMSVCFPARDEEADIEATLASFRGVADQMVIGIDPRSADRTREIAEKYAEVVFALDSPEGPPEERVPAGGVHFAHIRNQCIDRCDGDWIFMTEAHERLAAGQDVLLHLDRGMPRGAKVGYVVRSGPGHRGATLQQWAFPWLFANDSRIRFRRPTHNDLMFPEDVLTVKLPQVRTLHDRAKDRDEARTAQRKVQNRLTLMQDWTETKNEHSLYYLGSEWREYDRSKAVHWLREFLALPRKNGPARYQARLVLAKELVKDEKLTEAREVLFGCAEDDWSRTEHWLWLGDIAYEADRFEEALHFYLYGASAINEPPMSVWWLDLAFYTYLPAERLVMAYCARGRLEDATHWARKVVEMMPEGAPFEMLDEARKNLRVLEEEIDGRQAE